jgi:hypothetical protein
VHRRQLTRIDLGRISAGPRATGTPGRRPAFLWMLAEAGMLTIAEAQRRTELFLTGLMLEGRRFGFGYLPTAL